MLVPLWGVTLFNYRMAHKKQALLLVFVSTAISVVSLGQFASAQFSINSGQSCKSIGQIRDFQGQRFICRRVNAKAGSSSGPYLIWFKISSPKTTTSTSSTIKVSCATGGECRVGDIGAGGGVVFYVPATPQWWGRYMEAAPNRWNGSYGDLRHNSGCYGLSISDARAVGLGSGKQNTELIVSACPESNIAARVAYDLVLNGKSDWFLPSRDELNAMYPHREAIGFRLAENNQVYASSTWPSAFNFSAQMFTTDTDTSFVSGRQFETTRTTPYSYFVRPIRYGDFG
jgi:hypothetical protein